MESPVFEEFDPAGDCACPGCAQERRARPLPLTGRRLRRSAARRTALVVAAVTSAALGAHPVPAVAVQDTRLSAGQGVPADEGPGGGQGAPAPLYGPEGRTGTAVPPAGPVTVPAISRTDIIKRASSWVSQKVPYSVSAFWSDGYRQDCSGYVSMAWKLSGNEWTGSLAQYADKITKAELQPGDILLFHNASDPYNGSHVVIFGGWTDSTRSQYVAYEQTPPHTRRMTTPYAYWSNSARYVPYRYKGVTDGAAGAVPETAAPAQPPRTPESGVADSGPAADGADITGSGAPAAPGGAGAVTAVPDAPTGADAGAGTDAEVGADAGTPGRRGAAADPRLGPPARRAAAAGGDGTALSGGSASAVAGWGRAPSSHGVPGYPGRAAFRAGAENAHVTRLGRRLVETGFGRHYTTGPGTRWGEEDRRNVADFQRAQGWRGKAANGVPGPETWRRLFA
ncbi:peptidoglycan-binding protein [Streptomyces sp. NPDC057092]|uniref:peptidoglycan-binding protein n=1 Tax=Streptomyces sp. NPDC057092 TaxID=3346017 RepID=UPI00362BE7CB